ncbi:MAG TPA: hypothetical protein VL793_02420 [Patescibacteria group bacterium]|nr:hypothetical protein [Patescibacteria group bacterium]
MTVLKAYALAGAALVASAQPSIAQVITNSLNPYGRIISRNVFGLRPVGTVTSRPAVSAGPEIILTGLSSITGRKLALLKLEFPAKAPPRQKEEFCILKEGETDGPVRILQIDVKQGRVKIDNAGAVAVLTFEKNGPKAKPQPAHTRLPAYLPLTRR